jgi:micrococcal nuclease
MQPQAQKTSPTSYAALRRAVEAAVFKGRAEIEKVWTRTYHDTGRLINEHILAHGARAGYGAHVFERLAKDTGISKRTLHECAQFHRCFPIVRLTAQLTRTHYIVLCQVADEKQRTMLLRDAIREEWTVAQLVERVRPLNALENAPELSEAARDVTPSKMLTPRRGASGVCRVVADGDGLAVDLGFASYLALPGSRHSAGDFVRVTADGIEPAKDATKADLFTYRAEVLKVVDGDTLWVKIFLEPNRWVKEKLRLRDLDCPEMSTSEGKAAWRFTAALLARATEVTVCTTKPDKYDRYLADVFITHAGGETYLNNALLANAHATIKREWEFGDWTP